VGTLYAKVAGVWEPISGTGPISTDTPNAIIVGSDGGIFVRQLAYVVAKPTAPTAADYGQPAIPFRAVWVVTPP
jgi:hypothetical protein